MEIKSTWWGLLLILLIGSSCQTAETATPFSMNDKGSGAEEIQPSVPREDLKQGKEGESIEVSPVEIDLGFRDRIRQHKNAVPSMSSGEALGKEDIGTQRFPGVQLSAQQSASSYFFKAEVLCCYDDYYWFLKYPDGSLYYLESTSGYGAKIFFSLPLSALSGSYQVLVDAYRVQYNPNTGRDEVVYYDLESGPASVPILVSTPDVGVIPGPDGCGSQAESYMNMDNEDHNQASNVSGWVGKDYVDGAGNTRFYFCRVSGYSFSSLRNYSSSRTDYAVLQLGASCPPGSVSFARYFDNEDNANGNFWFGNISPNTSINDTWMRFCLFKGDGAISNGLPNLGFEYGVFASSSFGWGNASGAIFTDDEDTRNANGYEASASVAPIAQMIVSSGGNTTLRTARRTVPQCPDGACNGLETTSSCPADCGYCGDGVCYGSESNSCSYDCGYCGDGTCGYRETYASCASDCGGGCLSSSSSESADPDLRPLPCE